MIQSANPKAQYEAHRVAIDAAVQRVLASGWYVLGAEVRGFEQDFAAYLGAQHCVGVANGTDALSLALRACGIGAGHEVVTVSHTAVATVAAIELAGAVPVLVDIDPSSYTMDPAGLEGAITPRTRAVVVVHLYGHPANMEPILATARRHGLRIVEDCAQAHGARWQGRRVGTLGDISAFSFYPTKNLGAAGDGGAVVTNDTALADRVRMLREYGWRQRYVSDAVGMNSRLDEMQAAILRAMLPYLDSDNAARKSVAAAYDAGLSAAGLVLPTYQEGSEHVYHLYVVRSPQRDDLKQFLADHHIGALIHYPVPVHLQPAYRGRIRCADSMRHTEQAAAEVLSLPMYPTLSASDTGAVLQAVNACQRAAVGGAL